MIALKNFFKRRSPLSPGIATIQLDTCDRRY
nr:MAG TPA: hypothetical protein [Caudoviricetes sp.]DAM74816.1 MAG TPA: hypothetical protein [Caudoviricetes sp.]